MILGWVLFLAIWGVIVTHFFVTVEDEDEAEEKVPPAVYSIIFVMLFFFLTFGILNLIFVTRDKTKKNKLVTYKRCEWGYLGLSFSSKTLLTWLVLFGVISPRS